MNKLIINKSIGEDMYFIYMLRCKDNTIYTGITTDIKRRLDEHFSNGEKCAKYTSRHKAAKLEALWTTDNRKNASKLEYNIKRLNKAQKESLILNKSTINDYLKEKINTDDYDKIDYLYTNEEET